MLMRKRKRLFRIFTGRKIPVREPDFEPRIAKWALSAFGKGSFACRYGLYQAMIWALLSDEMGSFARR